MTLTAKAFLDDLIQFEEDSGYLNPPLKTIENLDYYIEVLAEIYEDENLSGAECVKLCKEMFELNAQK